MNSLIGDSRVRGLKFGPLANCINDLWFKPGARVLDMEDLVRDCVIMHHGEDTYDGKLHIYISAGICNITQRIKNNNYEEIIFNIDNADSVIDNAIRELDYIHKFTIAEGAVPIFTTIYPMSLARWNAVRLSQNKTKILNYADDYESMQVNMEGAVFMVNNHILELNKIVSMTTPNLWNQTKHHRGKKAKTSHKYNLLVDGCHPDSQLKLKIGESIAQAIGKNRNL